MKQNLSEASNIAGITTKPRQQHSITNYIIINSFRLEPNRMLLLVHIYNNEELVNDTATDTTYGNWTYFF
jgi:hypothetical protein